MICRNAGPRVARRTSRIPSDPLSSRSQEQNKLKAIRGEKKFEAGLRLRQVLTAVSSQVESDYTSGSDNCVAVIQPGMLQWSGSHASVVEISWI